MRKGTEAYKEYHRQMSKKHYQENKEDYREKAKRWKQEHRDEIGYDPVYFAEYREKFGTYINMRTREKNRWSMKGAHRAGGKWTDEEYARLRELILEGKTYDEIGLELGRSIKSVEHAKRRMFPELVTKARKRHNYITGEVMD